MITHLLFEQSGTFKNEFKKLGIEAYDYDIENQFKDYKHIDFKEMLRKSIKEMDLVDLRSLQSGG